MPNPKLRLVVDTGFLIAAALKNGYANEFLFANPELGPLHRALCTSPAILYELQDKLENKFGLNREIVLTYVEDLARIMEVITPRQKLKVVRDPDDNKILECAVAAKADIIVSADKDLLSLKQFESIKIVHPSSLKYLFPTGDGTAS